MPTYVYKITILGKRAGCCRLNAEDDVECSQQALVYARIKYIRTR